MAIVVKRELILEDVKDALALITVSNGFNTDVLESTREYVDWESVQKEKLPMLTVVDGPERVTGKLSDVYRPIMIVGIVGYLRKLSKEQAAASRVLISTTINLLGGDIRKKLMEDSGRSGNAIYTLYTGMRVFHGLPGPIAVFAQDWDVMYTSTSALP